MGFKKTKPKSDDTRSIAKANANTPPPFFNQHAREELLRKENALGIARRNSMSSSYMEQVIEDESEYYEEVLEESVKEQIPVIPPHRATKIRFEEYDEMMTVLHINDYTNHEIAKSWFKRDEYTAMSNLARKTATKAQERMKEVKEQAAKDKKGLKVIEARGLEAWTTEGAAQVKALKERAVEAVFYEQCRQWDAKETDLEKLREVYRAVSMAAQKDAEKRAAADFRIVQDELEKEREKQAKKESQKNTLKGKTKALVGKTAKKTASGVVKTAKLTGKATKKTGKKVVGKSKKEKRECEHQIAHVPSQSNETAKNSTEDHGTMFPVLVTDDDDPEGSGSKKKKKNLLGKVKKTKEEKHEKKIIKRKKKSNLPEWESVENKSSGKY